MKGMSLASQSVTRPSPMSALLQLESRLTEQALKTRSLMPHSWENDHGSSA